MLEQYQDIMTIFDVAEALRIGKTEYMSYWKKRAKGFPDWKDMENPQGSTAGIHPVTEQFKINRFIFIFLQPDKFQDTTFIPTNQAADLFQRPTLFHTHSHPKIYPKQKYFA